VIQIGALWTRTRKFLILLGERHHETARSQAPAGRALEPDGGDQREVSKFFQKRLSPMETEIRIVLGGSTNFEFFSHGIGLARY